ncbi:hypothetical protein Tco_0007428 [Tanacetum coccineum]
METLFTLSFQLSLRYVISHISVESYDEEGLGKEDASKQGRISDIDNDAKITLVSTHFDANTDMFGIHDLDSDEMVVESERRNVLLQLQLQQTVITDDEITLAKALAGLKSAKSPTQAASIRPKVKGIIIHEQEQAPTPTVSSQQPSGQGSGQG